MSKKQLKKLIEKNLLHAGYRNEPYGKFKNYFLDSLMSQSVNPYKSLRSSANLSREEMADLSGISEASIRRYESNWKDCSKVPKWYYILLRLVNGDLSFFGPRWEDTRIQHHDRKLKTHLSQKSMEP